jgi:hypothetical protein
MRQIWLLLFALPAAAHTIEIPDPKARLEVPASWTPALNDTAVRGWKFEKRPEGPCGIPIRLLVYIEHEEAGKPEADMFPLKDWPKEFPRFVDWKGRPVRVTYRLEGPEEARRVRMTSDVPLRRHALRVEMTATLWRAAEAAADFAGIVGSVEGDPSWRSPGAQRAYLASSLLWIPGFLLGLAYLGAWFFLWYGHPEAAPRLRLAWTATAGTMLLVAILLSPLSKADDKEPPSRLRDPRLHMALVLLAAALEKVKHLNSVR